MSDSSFMAASALRRLAGALERMSEDENSEMAWIVVVPLDAHVGSPGGIGARASNSMVWQPAVTEVRMPSERTPEPVEKPMPVTVKPRLSRTPCHAAGVPCHGDPEPPDVSGALSLSC